MGTRATHWKAGKEKASRTQPNTHGVLEIHRNLAQQPSAAKQSQHLVPKHLLGRTLAQVRHRDPLSEVRPNTAKILETNPVLMRLRELEVLEKVAGKVKLSVVLGEGGLAERVVKLL